LEKVSVSAGRNVAGGATFALSVKDIPLHLVRDGYIPQLRWMATKYVVLWDDVAHRGWLVNGTSALLHLVRASLEHYLTDDFSSLCLFDTSKLEESAHRKPNSAIEVLTNAQNMGLEIFPGKTDRFDQEVLNETGPSTDPERSKKQKKGDGYFLFEDLVEQTYRKLELIMAYQTYKAGENGKNLKVRVRKHLEGWDFADLAMDYDPHPRVATLQAFGYGWVDFVRSIDAISLFGCGFGDLIRPGGSVGLCPNWKSVPTGEYYLAASIADLNKIYERFGEGRLEPATSRPVGNLFWHSPGAAPVASCVQCRQKKSGQTTSLTAKHNHDPVQVFSPKRPFLPIRGPGLLEDDCAVIFGHSVSWGYHWSEDARRDLEEGDPPVATATTERSATAVTVIPNAGPSRLQVPPTPSRSSLSTRNTGESTIGPIRGNTPSANSDYSTPAQSLDETHQSPPVQSPSVHNTPGSIQPRLPDKSKIKDFLGRFKRPKKP
jgi:hypothetical protein